MSLVKKRGASTTSSEMRLTVAISFLKLPNLFKPSLRMKSRSLDTNCESCIGPFQIGPPILIAETKNSVCSSSLVEHLISSVLCLHLFQVYLWSGFGVTNMHPVNGGGINGKDIAITLSQKPTYSYHIACISGIHSPLREHILRVRFLRPVGLVRSQSTDCNS